VFPSGELGFGLGVDESAIRKQLVAPHDLVFDARAVRKRFSRHIEKAASKCVVPVLSAERLSGDPHLRRHDSVRIADRLAAVVPDARVLIVIREQRAMILSTYKQYVSAGGLLRLGPYLNSGRERPMVQWPFELDQFAYDRLIEHYHRRFGAEHVLVLPFELFQRDGLDFVSRIVRFAGAEAHTDALRALPFSVRENPANPPLFVAAKRNLNRALRQRLTPWGRLDPNHGIGEFILETARHLASRAPSRLNARSEERMRTAIARAASRHYGASNGRTCALIGIDLGEYGYDLAPLARRESRRRS
jgi:hypothetical protein